MSINDCVVGMEIRALESANTPYSITNKKYAWVGRITHVYHDYIKVETISSTYPSIVTSPNFDVDPQYFDPVFNKKGIDGRQTSI